MVSYSQIEVSNASLKDTSKGQVAVVAGVTQGIGKAFLLELAGKTTNPKIYFLGRNETTLSDIKNELTALNASGTYIPIKIEDLTLLSQVDAATKQILDNETKVDILYQSQGFLSFGGRNETSEGIDKIISIRFYGRMKFVVNLLPLLNAAPAPRVISTLAGGFEGKIFPDDLELKDPKNYSVLNVAGLSATYTTLFMEKLQEQNPKISFVHMYPGLVRTNIFGTEHFAWFTQIFFNWIFMPVVGRLIGLSPEEAGKRALYAATSPKFASAQSTTADKAIGSNGKVGTGVYTLNDKDEAVHSDKVLNPLREQGINDKIWEHSWAEFKRVTGSQ